MNSDNKLILAAMIEDASIRGENAKSKVYGTKELVDLVVSAGFKPSNAYKFRAMHMNPFTHGKYTIAPEVFVSVGPMADRLPEVSEGAFAMSPTGPSARTKISSGDISELYVPSVADSYVRWGYHGDIRKIIASKQFYPVLVSGLSGNGKTFMIEQACADTKRPLARVQITPETDEDDLLGGFRLIDGNTVFCYGPVINAMKTGSVLLLDEIDRGTNKIMALQSVLEGNSVLLKKTGEIVSPAPGFNVIATANTKGQGDDTGKFSAANIIDEAFLERFSITVEQPYPTKAIELKIVTNHMKKYGIDTMETTTKSLSSAAIAELLVLWSESIRKIYNEGGIEDLITTRRLCHIIQTISIFGDDVKAVKLCSARFPADTAEAFNSLYSKMRPVPAKEAAKSNADAISDVVNIIDGAVRSGPSLFATQA